MGSLFVYYFSYFLNRCIGVIAFISCAKMLTFKALPAKIIITKDFLE